MMQLIRTLLARLRALRLALTTALFYQRIKWLYPNVTLGRNIQVYGPLIWKVSRQSTVVIGDNVVFRSSTEHNAVGIYSPVTIAVASGATLRIDHDCGFSGTSICVWSAVTIGPYCNFGGNTSLWDTDFHPLDYKLRRVQTEGAQTAPITVGADAFVGAGAIVLKGTQIGERSIVGAGSVVTRRIPADEIWAGNPARFIRRVAQAETPVSEPIDLLVTVKTD